METKPITSLTDTHPRPFRRERSTTKLDGINRPLFFPVILLVVGVFLVQRRCCSDKNGTKDVDGHGTSLVRFNFGLTFLINVT